MCEGINPNILSKKKKKNSIFVVFWDLFGLSNGKNDEKPQFLIFSLL